MAALTEHARAAIRRSYFAGRWPIEAIAAVLQLAPRTVRRALVMRGGARSQPPAGPYRQESEP